MPYGGRSAEEIIKINQEIIPFLISQGAKLIVMACGTSSSLAFPVLKDAYPVELVNIIEPGSRAALNVSKNKKIGLIATSATVNSGAYQNMLEGTAVFAAACPLFVPLIEDGRVESDETRKVAKEYLKPLVKEGIDTLILGCTHYPHLRKVLAEILGPGVVLIDPAEETVSDVKKILKNAGTLKTSPAQQITEYFVTGSVIHFLDIGTKLLGKPIVNTHQVNLL